MTSSGTPLRRPAVPHALEEPPGHAAGERGVPSRDAAQERGDLLGRLRLQQVARRAGPDRGEEVLLRVRGRQYDDLGCRSALADLWERREAVHAGHREVEQHDVGLQLRGRGDRSGAVLGLADDVESLLHEQSRERIARERMVVDDENAFGHLALIGKRRRADK